MAFIRDLFHKINADPNILGRVLLVFLVILILFAAIALSGPKPNDDILPTLTPTPYPTNFVIPTLSILAEPSPEYTQTNGLIVGAVTILLVVVIGTVVEVNRKENKADKPKE